MEDLTEYKSYSISQELRHSSLWSAAGSGAGIRHGKRAPQLQPRSIRQRTTAFIGSGGALAPPRRRNRGTECAERTDLPWWWPKMTLTRVSQ